MRHDADSRRPHELQSAERASVLGFSLRNNGQSTDGWVGRMSGGAY
tara:strand:- start:159 stop:296 length:138 start_codon:yes stop_codon:yes gene_type:complete